MESVVLEKAPKIAVYPQRNNLGMMQHLLTYMKFHLRPFMMKVLSDQLLL
jgi:hypothetical protein